MSQQTPVNFRVATKDDLNFIFSSWLRSYREFDRYWAKSIPKLLYFDHHKRIVESILGISVTLMAVDVEDPGHIYGYIVFQPTKTLTIGHYCYVKSSFRMLGIASRLFDEMMKVSSHKDGIPVPCSHAGEMFHNYLKRKWNLVFNPYVLGEEFMNEDQRLDVSQRGSHGEDRNELDASTTL